MRRSLRRFFHGVSADPDRRKFAVRDRILADLESEDWETIQESAQAARAQALDGELPHGGGEVQQQLNSVCRTLYREGYEHEDLAAGLDHVQARAGAKVWVPTE